MRRLTLLSGLCRGQHLREAEAVGWQIMDWQTASYPNCSQQKGSWGLPSPGYSLCGRPECEPSSVRPTSGQGSTAAPRVDQSGSCLSLPIRVGNHLGFPG